jgi:flagellar biosynthesis protein FlhG
MNPNRTMSLSVLSGKGGVGKTSLALNLGYALSKAGLRVLLMDCDLGLANLDVMLGLSPERTLQDLLGPGTRPADVVLPVEPPALDLLPAASGVPELLDLDEDARAILVEKLLALISGYDLLVLDLGAGINETVLSFAAAAQARLVVVTPEPTALTDAYATIKVLFTTRGVRDFWIVVNQAAGKKEAQATFQRLASACRNFLKLEVRDMGFVRQDHKAAEAVRNQVPLMRLAPSSDVGKDILALAAKIHRHRLASLEGLAGLPILASLHRPAASPQRA